MLIDYSYFSNPMTRIAGIDQRSDGQASSLSKKLQDEIEAYIRFYEPKFLRMMLGKELAEKIDERPDIVAMLVNLADRSSVIAKYVYFYYQRDHATFNTIAGEKLKITESSKPVSAQTRLISVWNNMVDECRQIAALMDPYAAAPDYGSAIFEKINMYGL
ncbi:MAG: hypothetical protein ACLSVO_03085 [Alistipes sp.]|jgi:hypothetical protein|uniref:hypothetical protein n=1 Tax=Alistipes sp. TaxID=1872444 RepID=UPI002051E0C1|nr:MAG TPA: hypothetical protein [Caudoviricetes sp.]